jgi:hypothetical protein
MKSLLQLIYMKFNFLLFTVILFLFCGCYSSHPFDKETASFNNYLTSNFNKQIGDDSCSYILVPSNACLGCIGTTLNLIFENSRSKKSLLFVVSEKALMKYQMDDGSMSNSMVLVDHKIVVDRLPYHKGNIGLIKTASGQIYKIVAFDAANLKNIYEQLK